MMDGPLYHGTRRGFSRGGFLMPRRFHGGEGTTAPLKPGMRSPADAGQWCYVTTELDLAWVYAWHAVGRGKPKVLVVKPLGAVEQDPEHGTSHDAWRCEMARVVRILTKPTVTEADAMAGWVL